MVLVVVFVAIVGVLVCYNHKVNKVVMKVSTNIMQNSMRAEMFDTFLAHHWLSG